MNLLVLVFSISDEVNLKERDDIKYAGTFLVINYINLERLDFIYEDQVMLC